MAVLTRAQIQTLIDSYNAKVLLYITSNNNKEITGAQLKEILDENGVLLEDVKDSYYNLLDDIASLVNYSPLNPVDWNVTIPTEVKAGLDQIAQRLRDLENASNVFIYTIELYANTDSTVSNIFPLYGKVLLFGSDNKSSKVTDVSYETSTDGGDTWTPRVDFTALDTYLTSATTPTSFIFVRAIFTFALAYAGEQAITLNYTQA